ncbi:hypothetical protein BGZ98_008810 [Dissophora globulifera]|nr:hypothetical protein BGZ98_008810 [Dissophora globulifera]
MATRIGDKARKIIRPLGRPNTKLKDKDVGKVEFSLMEARPLKSEFSASQPSSKPPGRHLGSASNTGSLLSGIFPENLKALSVENTPPKIPCRFETTSQLAFCVCRYRYQCGRSRAAKDPTDAASHTWLNAIERDPNEKDRIFWLASRLAMEFAKDKLKVTEIIAEVIPLGPVLEEIDYTKLLGSIVDKIRVTSLMSDLTPLLQGLVQLLQSAAPMCHNHADLVGILDLLKDRLDIVHKLSSKVPYHLILVVSRVLQVMEEHKVKDIDRASVHERLSKILSGFKDSTDPYVIYQASYAFQALQYIPHNESVLRAFLRHSGGLAQGLAKVSRVATLDLGDLLEGLGKLQKTSSDIYQIGKSVYEGIRTLFESGRGAFDSIKKGAGMGHKRPWYVAIRGAETLVQEGRLADLNQLICGAACRKDSRFQWGICQLLGEIAIDSEWDISTRRRGIDILGRLYRDDSDWGRDPNIKQWMVTIIRQIIATARQSVKDHAAAFQSVKNHAAALLQELKIDGSSEFQVAYPISSRLQLPKPYLLLRKVQDIPYVEHELHRLKSEQLQWHDDQAVYIPPQAKASLDASDHDHLPLMEEVEKFLRSKREVLLILGDTGAGTSTFSNKLAYNLWKDYKNEGPIPIHIQLLGIDRPDHEMIRKQLTIHEFSPDYIKELKLHREFIVICDGYDESRSKTNLYDTNLFNQPGQWQGKLIICCRSQYLRHDYRGMFQPHLTRRGSSDRAALGYFQESVIVPFTQDQIESYVEQYVKLSLGEPEWTATDYMEMLEGIPNLMDLVKNPYLLTVSLGVLPDIIDMEEDLSSINVTTIVLYDVSMGKWMIRSKEYLRKQELLLLPAEQAALNRLFNDNISFEQHCIRFMKDLSTLVMEEHAGVSKIEYAKPTEADNNRIPSYLGMKESLVNHPLRMKNIVDNPFVVQLLAERAKANPFLKQQLLAMIESLETDAQSVQAEREV